MKFLRGLLFVALVAAASPSVDGFWQSRDSNYNALTPAGVAYVGPGDVVSGATAWYGLRAYNAAYATGSNKAVNLRRASDNTACDFDIASSGALGNSDSGCSLGGGLSLATFATQDATCTGTIASTTLTCASASSTPHAGSTLTGAGITQPSYIVSCGTFTGGAGTCTLNIAQTVSVGETITMTYGLYVAEAYDQTGNGHHVTQSTAANQPQLLPTCLGSFPCVAYTSSSSTTLASSTNITPGGVSLSYSQVYIRTGNFTAGALVGENGVNNNRAAAGASANLVRVLAGVSSVTATASDSTWHAVNIAEVSSGNTIFNVDGTETSDAALAPNTTAGTQLFGSTTLTGYMGEGAFWEAAAFTGTQRTNLCKNQQAYYGAGNFGAAC